MQKLILLCACLLLVIPCQAEKIPVDDKVKKNTSTQVRPTESGSVPDSLSRQVAEIFKKVDELQERKKQRSTEYLSSLSDEKLAEIYTKHTRNEDPLFALESVKKDRPRVINILLSRVLVTWHRRLSSGEGCGTQFVCNLLSEIVEIVNTSFIA